MVLVLLLGCRPDTPLGAYTAADELQVVDGAHFRVHFSDRGPNAADQTDLDDDGTPDVATADLAEAEASLAFYEALGFRAPVPESELLAGEPGGSPNTDIYLTDRAGRSAAGITLPDACDTAGHCVVHILAPSDDPQVDGLVAHEVFHAVQAAYSVEGPWFAEGSAKHMEMRYEGTWTHGIDVIGADWADSADAYLSRSDCGLASIAYGQECEEAAYGTFLLWEFLEQNVQPDILRLTLETEEPDGVDAIETALEGLGTGLAERWPIFAAWNLGTGPREGPRGARYETYFLVPDGVVADAEGASVAVHRRMEPLSARYYRIDHAGGDLRVRVGGDGSPLRVTAQHVWIGGSDGPLGEIMGPFGLPTDGTLVIPDVPAGGVWVAVSHVDPAAPAVDVDICIGDGACDDAGCAYVPVSGAWVLGVVAMLVGTRRSCAA